MTSPSTSPLLPDPRRRRASPASRASYSAAPDGQGTRRAVATQPPAAARPQASGAAASEKVYAQLPSSNPVADGMTEAQRRRMRVAGGKFAGALASTMSEAQLENGIRRILKDLPDVLWYHTRDSRRSPSGFPDLVAVGPGGVLYRELKTMRGRVTRAQDEWLFALTDAGQDADIWRPDALLSGRVARELAAISGLKVPWPAGARGRRGGAGISEEKGGPA